MNPFFKSLTMQSRLLARGIPLLLILTLSGCGSTPVKQTQATIPSSNLNSLTAQQLERFHTSISALKSEKPKDAESQLKKLLAAKPDVAEIWINLALSQYQQQKFNTAQSTIDNLMSKNKSIPQAHNILGLIAVQNGKFTSAEQSYTKAIQLNPKYSHALYNLALLQDVYLQNIEQAIIYYQQYLQIETEDQPTKDWVEHLRSNLTK